MTYGLSNDSILQPPWPFNFTDVLDSCRNATGLPPSPFWLETEFGGYVSGGGGRGVLEEEEDDSYWAAGWAGPSSWPGLVIDHGLPHFLLAQLVIVLFFLVKKSSFVSGYWECAEEIREQHPLLQQSAGSVELQRSAGWRVII